MFPLVFFLHGRVLPLRPAHPAPHLHPGIAPATAFFVRVRRFFFLCGGGGSLFILVFFFSLFFSLSLSLSRWPPVQSMRTIAWHGVAYETAPPSGNYDCDVFGRSISQHPGRSVLSYRRPYLSCKCLLADGGPYCHANVASLFPLFKGESGANVCFWCLVALCFRSRFAHVLCLLLWLSVPNMLKQFSSCLVFLFGSFSLFSGPRRQLCAFVLLFCFFKRYRSRPTGHHTSPRTCLLVCLFFLFQSPPRLCYRPFWPSFLFWRFLGVRFWALRVLEFLDSLGISWGLSSLALSEAPFLDARRQGCLCRFSFVLFVFPFFVVFAAAHLVVPEGPPRELAEAGPGDLARPGTEGWSPPCLDRFFLSSVCVGVAGTTKALLRQWTLLDGGCPFTRVAPFSLSLYPPLGGP